MTLANQTSAEGVAAARVSLRRAPEAKKSADASFVVKDPLALATRLEKANIDVKIDQPLLLLSPSVYNNQTEIDKLLNAVS
jgi:selenocysteine lyase/cysteine desulfurase